MWLPRISGLRIIIHDQHGLFSFTGGLGLLNSVGTNLFGGVSTPSRTNNDLCRRVFSSDRDLGVLVVRVDP